MSRIFVSFFIVSLLVLAHTCAGQKNTRCERNAEPKQCGKLCEPTCEKPGTVFCNPANPELCKIECRCNDGYVRYKKQCIKVDHCPRTKRSVPPERCPLNETLAICGSICEPSCRNPHPEVCPAIPCSKATERCRCNEGYLRDTTARQCVRRKDCSENANPKACGVNEEFGACGRICEGTCKDQNPGKCAAVSCMGYGCMCKQGFYRNEETDKCVPVGQCPKPKK